MCDTFTWSPRDVAGTLANTAPRRKWKEQTGRDRDERLRYFRNIWKLKSVWADIYNFLQYLHVCRPFIWRDKTFINWWIYILRNDGLSSTKQTRSQLMLCLMSMLVQKWISKVEEVETNWPPILSRSEKRTNEIVLHFIKRWKIIFLWSPLPQSCSPWLKPGTWMSLWLTMLPFVNH